MLEIVHIFRYLLTIFFQREGHSFGGEEGKEVRREVPKDPNVVQSQQEEDDIAKE